jgi:hypothetical protein
VGKVDRVFGNLSVFVLGSVPVFPVRIPGTVSFVFFVTFVTFVSFEVV